MKTVLAEKLLSRIMEWGPDEVSVERPLLQALANFKYDEYQQYSPGMRFIESLAKWLKQFKTKEEKDIAYQFIKRQLIFISRDQVSHLVTLAYPETVEPMLIEKTAKEMDLSPYEIVKIINSSEFKKNKRQMLFLGLSDGAKIDFFRRVSGINNEQVYPTYQISEGKAIDMLSKLREDKCDKFNSVFLIDDFTASGRSYFRKDSKTEWGGKIWKFLKSVFEEKTHYRGLIDTNNLDVNVLFYIATEDALSYIGKLIEDWKREHSVNIKVTIHVIQILKNNIKMEITSNAEFYKLIQDESYFDHGIIDKHFKKGNHAKPFLGFNECALPLILNHNTPNNSLPILWIPGDKEFTGLFPRITRHKE